MLKFIGLIVLVSGFGLVGCGSEDESNDGNSSGSTGGSSQQSSTDGSCAADKAGQPCEGDCSFTAAEVDCATACQNIADKCATAECDSECTGLNQDVATCTAACEGTKSMYCTNETFGCWATESTCEGVGTCFDAATSG